MRILILIFSYKIALQIANSLNIPIITYICDDYYLNKKKSISPIYNLNKFLFKKEYRNLMSYKSNCIYICEKMQRDYEENFKNKAITLMTTSNLEKDNNCIFRLKNDKKISYIGNLGYNRWKALIDIGRLVKEISNGEMNIDVYSSESRSEIIKHLNFENGISFRGSLDAKQVIEKINDSDVLIHVESLDSVNREKVKYSISTKIADMLSSGKYLLIYGPKEVASIEYFSENNAALVSTSKEQLRKNIKLLINDHYESEYINNALSLSEKNHSKEKNDKILKKFVEFTKNNWES